MNGTLEVDVLIVGGGIMGLWLLNDVQARGYKALLFESFELGGQQTCHSHVYIHQGHIYNEIEGPLAARLQSVTEMWTNWLGNHPGVVTSTVSYFGFRDEVELKDKLTLWGLPTLRLESTDVPESRWPDALRGGAVKRLVETPERSLDGHLLVKELTDLAGRESIIKVTGSAQLRLKHQKDGVEAETKCASGHDLLVKSRFVVFAAGAGNLRLLNGLLPEKDQRDNALKPQQIRKGRMLVIRGPKSALPQLTGVFRSFGGLFIVCRELPDENVWLVSDNRSEPMVAVEDWIIYDSVWWLPRVLAYLKELSPLIFDNARKLAWGIYEAPKAEGSTPKKKLPEEERLLTLNSNMWAIWPTKLTLAPQASATLIETMNLGNPGAYRVAPSSAAWPQPDVAPERWTKIPMTDWDMFCRVHSAGKDF